MHGLLKLPSAVLLCLLAIAEGAFLHPRAANDSLPSCTAECFAAHIEHNYYWEQQTITSSVVAATLVYIIDERTNTTRTETKFNELPEGVTRPPLNAKGTHVSTITVETAVGRTTEVELAFPTSFLRYPLTYFWYGTLPTIDAAGNRVCSTAEAQQDITYSAYTTPAQGKATAAPDDDPGGFYWSLASYDCFREAFGTVMPNDAAPSLCMPINMCGVRALQTVALLTETEVVRERSTPTPPPGQGGGGGGGAGGGGQPQQPPQQGGGNSGGGAGAGGGGAQPQQPPTQGGGTGGQPQQPPQQGGSGGQPQAQPQQQPQQGPGSSPQDQPAPAQVPGAALPTPTSPNGGDGIGTNGEGSAGNGLTGVFIGEDQSGSGSAEPPQPLPAPIIIGASMFSADSGANFVVGSQTLTPGGQITADNTIVSLAPDASLAVVNGATQALVPLPVLAIGGESITANMEGQFIAGDATLAVGSVATFGSGASMTVVSLTTASGRTVAVVDGISMTLSADGFVGSRSSRPSASASSSTSGDSTGDGAKIRLAWRLQCVAFVMVAIALL